ncbi:MAG: DNA repair protein RecN [Puniceicoccaceae bacterium]|nr:MAG: DNA repair protein RecN [Puniceicoccaceae bacterium]
MLHYLKIHNLALLDTVELTFGPGFAAVTGETGAGKSILLGALALLSGSRAEKSLIRQGADSCLVEAALALGEREGIDRLLEERGLPPRDEGELILRRELFRDRAGRCFVNGSLATTAVLQELGEHWIDFHGPGEPRRLLKPECQLALLDLYAGLGPMAEAYRERFDEWKHLLGERDRIAAETRLDPDQVEFLRSQVEKIDRAELDGADPVELESAYRRVSRGQELTELAGSLADGLGGDDGVLGRLAGLVRAARELETLDPALTPLTARIDALAVEAEDLGQEFQRLQAAGELDPEEAARVEERYHLLLELKRKYGGSIAGILEARASLLARIGEQGDVEGTLRRLEKQASDLERLLRGQAGELRRAREKAGKELARKARVLLGELGFRKAGFEVRLEPGTELRSWGDASPEFLFSGNAGQPLLPLGKVASSGELARVMLALKTILAEVDEIPVLVFDEVDANVGGEIGRVAGLKLREVARRHQVFCITHLPQVAGLAAQHLLVEKQQAGGSTVIRIREVHRDADERVGELARMLGDRRSDAARRHARELLEA